MANSYTNLIFHCVWHVKGKQIIPDKFQPFAWQYMGGILANKEHKPILINGTANHVHVLVGMHQSQSVAAMIRELKASSSRHFKEKGWVMNQFAWQTGYAAFTVSRESLPRVYTYIQNQKERHTRLLYRDELIWMLELAELSYDNRYLIDEISDDLN